MKTNAIKKPTVSLPRVTLLTLVLTFCCASVAGFLSGFDSGSMHFAAPALSLLYLLSFYAMPWVSRKARIPMAVFSGLTLAAAVYLMLTVEAVDTTWGQIASLLLCCPFAGFSSLFPTFMPSGILSLLAGVGFALTICSFLRRQPKTA